MKYYILCGELERIVEATSPEEGCEKSINLSNGETIGEYFNVSEKGFRQSSLIDEINTIELKLKDCTTDKWGPEWVIPVNKIIHTIGENDE